MTDVIEARRTALEDLSQRYGVARLALFGSALRDDFDPDTTDLDLVVEFSPMSPSEHAGACFGLLVDLENLFARRVDLVEIGAVRNPCLRWEIEEHQETLSGALSGLLTQNCGSPSWSSRASLLPPPSKGDHGRVSLSG